MGVGHVPPGALPAQSQGDELPRRQHRRAGALAAPVARPSAGPLADGSLATALANPSALARLGEDIAARFLVQRGLSIVARNHLVDRGEIDIIAVDGRQQVAVEVKTRRGRHDPTDAFTENKERQVRGLAGQLGIGRVDLVAVSVGDDLVEIRWLPSF